VGGPRVWRPGLGFDSVPSPFHQSSPTHLPTAALGTRDINFVHSAPSCPSSDLPLLVAGCRRGTSWNLEGSSGTLSAGVNGPPLHQRWQDEGAGDQLPLKVTPPHASEHPGMGHCNWRTTNIWVFISIIN